MRRIAVSAASPIACAALLLYTYMPASLSGCGGGTRGTGGYEVSGKVYDSFGTGIAEATITVENSNGQPIATTRADETGGFSLSNVSEDNTFVRVEKSGKQLGVVEISLGSANESAYLELRERPDAGGCIDSSLQSDTGNQATNRVTVWGNLAPESAEVRSAAFATDAKEITFPGGVPAPTLGVDTDSALADLATEARSDYVTVVTVQDATGRSRDLFLSFTRRGGNEFAARVYGLSSEVGSPSATSSSFVALGDDIKLRFNQDGSRSNQVEPFGNDEVLNVEWIGVEQTSSIGLNLNNITAQSGPFLTTCVNIEQ